tara:strand:- start:248 stop:1210 length:963 start_codon:yes stop_codon:yes gene_type:complete
MTKPVVVLTRKWTETVEAAMSKIYNLRTHPKDESLSLSEILLRCSGAEVLCPAADTISEEFIRSLPETIKLIANFGSGTDHIDISAAKNRGILVSNTPEEGTEEVADLAFGLIIAACRRFHEGNKMVREDAWPRGVLNFTLGQRVWGQKLGIVGLGQIGSAIARRAQGFQMPVLYHNRQRNLQAEIAYGAEYFPTLEKLLQVSDIVVLATPGGPKTRHLIDAEKLALMKMSSVLINVGRGPLIDEAALAKVLKTGQIAAAGLDVHEFEPEVSREIRKLSNVFLLTHMGTNTLLARDAIGFRVMKNVKAYLDTGEPIDQVV